VDFRQNLSIEVCYNYHALKSGVSAVFSDASAYCGKHSCIATVMSMYHVSTLSGHALVLQWSRTGRRRHVLHVSPYPLCYQYAKYYQSWWKFDKVMAKTILHARLRRYARNKFSDINGRLWQLWELEEYAPDERTTASPLRATNRLQLPNVMEDQ